jgi:diguanylate cyclase (GGDEF)-like protein/PAS domain S-box-containing protein
LGTIALAIGYYALAFAAGAIAPEAGRVIVCWPASGLVFAVLLQSDLRRWPELLAAGGVAAALFNLGDKPLDVTLAFVAADLVVPALGAALVRAWVGGMPTATRIRDVVALSVAGGAVAPAAGAVVATVGVEIAGGDYERVWVTLFLSHSIGVLLVVPLVLAGIAFADKPRGAGQVLEIVGLTLLSGVVSLGFFVTDLPLTWVLLIVPLAAALRHGLIGSATAFAPVTVVGLLATTHGQGPYAGAVGSDADALALFQTFAAVGGALCNVLAASVGQLGTALGRLRRSEDRFRMLVEGVRDHAIFTLDGAGRIDSWNEGARGVFGYSDAEVAGAPLQDLATGTAEGKLKAGIAAAGDSGAFEGEAAVRRADGGTFLAHFTISRLRPDDDATMGFAVVVRDVTETSRAERQLRHMALHDTLTGLPNRVLLTDRMAVALAAAAREGNHVAVLFCDLDHFKAINDSLGHAVGDAVLVGVADRFREVVRAQDTVARHGGDEFVVCFGDVAGADEAVQLAERVRTELEKPITVRGEELHVGASIGIALSDPDSHPDDLLREADVAMYRAKHGGTGHALADADDRAAIKRLRGMTASAPAAAGVTAGGRPS